MPCRIDLSRIFRASSGANGSLPSLPWAWPAFWTKGPKALQTLAIQALNHWSSLSENRNRTRFIEDECAARVVNKNRL
jgi:hypothetical protein